MRKMPQWETLVVVFMYSPASSWLPNGTSNNAFHASRLQPNVAECAKLIKIGGDEISASTGLSSSP